MTLKKRLMSFNEFVIAQEKQNKWDEYKEKWKNDIKDLENVIKYKWFNELEDNNLAIFEFIPIKRYEENLGEYSTMTLEITFVNNKTIVIEPVVGVTLYFNGKLDFYLRGNIIEKLHIIRKISEKSKSSWFIIDPKRSNEKITFNKTNVENIFEKWLQ